MKRIRKLSISTHLTDRQKLAILSACEKNDFCFLAHGLTIQSLCEKGFAKLTSGFGHKFGRLAELTDKGKDARETFLKQKIGINYLKNEIDHGKLL